MVGFNFIPTELINLDESLDRYVARLELVGKKCGLKHAPSSMNIEAPDAVNYLSQYLGYNKESRVTELLRVPICAECIEGLYDDDWALLYCVTCHSSQWIFKPKSKLIFHSDVVWLDECPGCSSRKED